MSILGQQHESAYFRDCSIIVLIFSYCIITVIVFPRVTLAIVPYHTDTRVYSRYEPIKLEGISLQLSHNKNLKSILPFKALNINYICRLVDSQFRC